MKREIEKRENKKIIISKMNVREEKFLTMILYQRKKTIISYAKLSEIN
jgi:hypothetical protein